MWLRFSRCKHVLLRVESKVRYQIKTCVPFQVADVKIPLYFHGSATNLQDDIALVIAATPFKLGADYKVEPVCLNFDVEKDKLELSPGNNGKVKILNSLK